MLCQLFINLTEWDERQVMCWQLIGNIKLVKSYRKFTHSCTLRHFLGLEIVVKICSLCNKTFCSTVLKNSE